jgi:hypothetical protein
MTNPAPQFRPRRSRQKTDPRRPWIKWAALTGAGALLVLVGTLIVLQLTGDDDDATADGGEGTPGSQSTSGSADAREPFLTEPPFAYVVQLEDLADPDYKSSPNETYVVSDIGFASGPYFTSLEMGESKVNEWGYLGGYQAILEPIGESADVAQGKHVVRSESFIFNSVEGARAAYQYLEEFHTTFSGSETVEVQPLGNDSSAFTILENTIPGTELPGAYHRYIARRGNLVYIAQVFGVLQFTNIDQARDYAVIIDAKATGERPAPTPTPPSSGDAGAAPTLPPPPSTTPTP